MAEKIFELGSKRPVCSVCGEVSCDHLFPRPKCKHCGRRREDHVGDDHKCLFEPTCYEPMRLFSTLGDVPLTWESLERSYLHKTHGGKGVVARLKGKK